jgi:carbon storage regulator
MLALSRKIGQAIVIDPTKCPRDELGRIVVVVMGIRKGHVQIGVDAPKGVPVHRQEVQDAIDRENAA